MLSLMEKALVVFASFRLQVVEVLTFNFIGKK